MRSELKVKIQDLNWDKVNGLIPTIVQGVRSGRVLMLGFMNPKALEKTMETGLVTFWSRSRQKLWTKGETSGNSLKVKEIRPDCDGDSLLALVEPQGPTCHRGTVSCFGQDDELVALEFLDFLEGLILDRKKRKPRDSYTTELFEKGLPQIAKKVGEEAAEVIVSAFQNRQSTVEESADLLFHLLVFLAEREVSMVEVVEELKRRNS